MIWGSPVTLIGLTVFLQPTLVQYLSVGGARSDLCLVVVLYLGLSRTQGGNYGIVVGLLQDLAGGGILGLNTLSKGLLGLLSEVAQRQLLSFSYPTLVLLFLLATLFEGGLFLLLTQYLLTLAPPKEVFLRTLMFQTLINAVFGPLIVFLLNRLAGERRRRR
ncbi:MAG: rod shape-determining protein MreD [Candidatus Tectomicrobia bacterium]|uniref:Rod shape-determining protein MreD n=1 Tax=Tectimicrobiota bacterium TaxID=2528274 RepID=A0A932CQ91_UNCTE|nr:rod shape-determining protein MreD [Candidatus Tectomicrobia bacterium]